MGNRLIPVKVAPKGMGLNDFVAFAGDDPGGGVLGALHAEDVFGHFAPCDGERGLALGRAL